MLVSLVDPTSDIALQPAEIVASPECVAGIARYRQRWSGDD